MKASKEETPCVYNNIEPTHVQVTNFYLWLQKTEDIRNLKSSR